MAYRQLDSVRILDTLDRLISRIEERFPTAGLANVAREFRTLAHECVAEAQAIARPNWIVRIGTGVLIVLIVLAAVLLGVRIWQTSSPGALGTLADVVQAIEAAVNDVVFLGIAIFFIVTIETRLKRRRALKHLHQLRSIAHVVDMHQLTKDPERVFARSANTPSSPVRSMTPPELARYLDYCSEVLSLASKIAALFVQHFDDPVVLAAVTEVENLATDMSRNVWQKISLLERA
jgi:hypothetical protein